MSDEERKRQRCEYEAQRGMERTPYEIVKFRRQNRQQMRSRRAERREKNINNQRTSELRL